MWNICINGEEPITSKGALDERQRYHTNCGKSNVNISLCQRKSYQRTDIEEIWSIFDQVRPVVSHLVFFITEEPINLKNIGESLKVTHHK